MCYSQIGDYIDKDKSVVSREVSSNSDAKNSQYKTELAHRKAKDRHATKDQKCKMMNPPELSLGRFIILHSKIGFY